MTERCACTCSLHFRLILKTYSRIALNKINGTEHKFLKKCFEKTVNLVEKKVLVTVYSIFNFWRFVIHVNFVKDFV